MSDVRLIDSREPHKRLSDLSERWYRAKKFGVAQGLAMVIEEVCNTDTIDPIRAAGGCRCGECKKYMTSECPLCSFDADGSCTGGPNSDFFCGNSELIGGEDDG